MAPDISVVLVSCADGGQCAAEEQPILRVPPQRRGEIQLRICPDFSREGGLGPAGRGHAERGEAGTEQQNNRRRTTLQQRIPLEPAWNISLCSVE